MNGGMSAFGTKRTFRSQRSMSALGVGADIARAADRMRGKHLPQSFHLIEHPIEGI